MSGADRKESAAAGAGSSLDEFVIKYRQRHVVIGEVWFDASLAPRSGVDVVRIRESLEPLPGRAQEEVHTLLLDLSAENDLLWSRLTKENRYEIRRAETKDRLAWLILTSPSCKDYDNFAAFYRLFAAQKGIPDMTELGHSIMRKYLAADRLMLACARKDSEALVWHAYYVQGERCRLLSSASHFRGTNDSSVRSLVGRANRWLHWNEMLFFKDSGIRVYDWGGWHNGTDPVLLRINAFKESFGGKPTAVFNARYGITLVGRVENALWNVARRWRDYRRLGRISEKQGN